ncbi:hypothetical protein PR048_013014 [Dryococelus australis]|uniref:Uncharacterized protein n=1 Tax=Dryococelus australis TaxID=614101 RepID=A0ABQ9HQY6_9NEOP|nr:hypothetical protein PR048_013014 [Dryococelus australis]
MSAAKTTVERNRLTTKQNIHHRKAEKARSVMRVDYPFDQHPTSDTRVASEDLQQVLFLPILSHNQICEHNQNNMVLYLWVYLVVIGVFKRDEHKFSVFGHSFLSCDRHFAAIRKGT